MNQIPNVFSPFSKGGKGGGDWNLGIICDLFLGACHLLTI